MLVEVVEVVELPANQGFLLQPFSIKAVEVSVEVDPTLRSMLASTSTDYTNFNRTSTAKKVLFCRDFNHFNHFNHSFCKRILKEEEESEWSS